VSDDRYTFTDWLWEAIDTGLYLAHLALVVLLTASAIACPVLLWLIRTEVRDLREHVGPGVTVIDIEEQCRHCDDGPGPVLPRVLPRVRRIGEGAE